MASPDWTIAEQDQLIADAIERYSPRPTADLRELYRRVVFSVLTANTDDHLRNHAFLRRGRGWALWKALVTFSGAQRGGDCGQAAPRRFGWRYSPRQVIGRVIADHARPIRH